MLKCDVSHTFLPYRKLRKLRRMKLCSHLVRVRHECRLSLLFYTKKEKTEVIFLTFIVRML